MVIVNESETSSLATTELGVESIDNNVSSVNLELLGEFLSDLLLGDGGSVWVEDINSHLSSGEQRVSKDLLGSDNDSHFWIFWVFFLLFLLFLFRLLSGDLHPSFPVSFIPLWKTPFCHVFFLIHFHMTSIKLRCYVHSAIRAKTMAIILGPINLASMSSLSFYEYFFFFTLIIWRGFDFSFYLQIILDWWWNCLNTIFQKNC